eukprot:TRINITY_DN4839_c0_g3_i2.p1 TRINITY_DN4839_c0_g3~~TRINITY_DN4839_c0_g3_i2.p1  ORF type:complete len:318 (-),score=49.43 TRINITY_DN4839_c0_g3_i2:74-1027(-)
MSSLKFPISIFGEAPRNHNERIHIRNPTQLRDKLRNLCMGGLSKLQIISDFDRTISRFKVNDKLCPATFGVFHLSPHSPLEFRKAASELFAKYHVYEIDPRVPYAKKNELMEEWVFLSQKLIADWRFSLEDTAKILDSAPIFLRAGVAEAFSYALSKDIDVYIISAGIGDMVTALLDKVLNVRNEEKMSIVSNFMHADESGIITSFKAPLLHSLNKSQVLDKATMASLRTNTILLGDFPHDIHMADQVGSETLLTIGFLNEKEDLLKDYTKYYDVIILNDGNFDILTRLLQFIDTKEVDETVTQVDTDNLLKPLIAV